MKNSINKIIEPFGEFKFDVSQCVWFSFAKNICLENVVELSIGVENSSQDLSDKVLIVKEFVNNINIVTDKLYNFIHKEWFSLKKTLEEVRTMYFLTAIELKNDSKTWLITFEPEFEIESIYNHFLRFALVKNEVIWNNLTENKRLV